MTFSPEAVRQFEHQGWQQAAAAYDETFAHASRAFVVALLHAAAVGPRMRVLDSCCGTGVAAASAADRGAEVTGIDFSAAMLARARAAHPALRFDEGDAEALPYDDAAFDAVINNFGLHHVPRPDRALVEACRVLRPCARIAVTSWAAPAQNIAWQLLFEAIRRCDDPNASKTPPSGGGLDSPGRVRDLLREAGFRDVVVELVRREWQLQGAADLVAALRQGTVRTAALIAAQSAAAMPAILAEIEQLAAPYQSAAGLAVPIVAVLGRGVK